MERIPLKQILLEKFNLKITPAQCAEAIKIVQRYELRGENMMAFNSPYLGVHKAYFIPKDADAIFDCFGVYKTDFARDCKRCSAISSSWNVTGNDFNILITWLVYLLGKTTGLNPKLVRDTRFNLIKLLIYKFFTGKVAVMFKHGVNEGVMQYTIDNLSAKSDIKKPETNTWRLLIESHVNEVLEPDSIHAKFIDTYLPDEKMIYFLSDLHTRISSKIKNVAEEYYANHAQGNSIGTTSIMTNNEDGEKVLGELKATLDNEIIRLQQVVLNPPAFINYNHLQLASGIANIRSELLRKALMLFCDMAQQQYKAHRGDDVMVTKKKEQLYIGYRILIAELIQKSYRRAALNGADMQSNVSILKKVADAYRASRISDTDILLIKNSIDYFVEQNLHIQREATAVALRTAMILYFIIMSFNKR